MGCYFLVGSFRFDFVDLLKIQFGSQVHSIFPLIFFICRLSPRDRGDFLLVWILLPEGRKSDTIFDQTQKPNKGPSIRSDEHHIGDTGGYKEIKKKKNTKWEISAATWASSVPRDAWESQWMEEGRWGNPVVLMLVRVELRLPQLREALLVGFA